MAGSGVFGKYYSISNLNDPRIDRLPYSIQILLESSIRNCDNFQVTKNDVEKIIDWENTSPKQVEIPFKPARVLLQKNIMDHFLTLVVESPWVSVVVRCLVRRFDYCTLSCGVEIFSSKLLMNGVVIQKLGIWVVSILCAVPKVMLELTSFLPMLSSLTSGELFPGMGFSRIMSEGLGRLLRQKDANRFLPLN